MAKPRTSLQEQIDALRHSTEANFRAVARAIRSRNLQASAQEKQALEAHLAPGALTAPITSASGQFGRPPTGMSSLDRLRADNMMSGLSVGSYGDIVEGGNLIPDPLLANFTPPGLGIITGTSAGAASSCGDFWEAWKENVSGAAAVQVTVPYSPALGFHSYILLVHVSAAPYAADIYLRPKAAIDLSTFPAIAPYLVASAAAFAQSDGGTTGDATGTVTATVQITDGSGTVLAESDPLDVQAIVDTPASPISVSIADPTATSYWWRLKVSIDISASPIGAGVYIVHPMLQLSESGDTGPFTPAVSRYVPDAVRSTNAAGFALTMRDGAQNDTFDRLKVYTSSKATMAFGSGLATQDVKLYRSGVAKTLTVDTPAEDATAIFDVRGTLEQTGVPVLTTGSFAVPNLTLGTANGSGVATTAIRSDATILAFDATTPAAVSTSGSPGAATTAPRRDHVHPHEAAHINHDTTWAAKGDLIVGTANDTAAVLTVGANDTIHMADSAATTGTKWAAPATVKTALGYYTSGDSPTFATITTTGDIELGNASDTTLARSSAGVVTIEGVTVATYSTGTFTPALQYATVGTSSWAVTTAAGWYTKIGDRVIFHYLYTGVPTNGTGAGNLQLTGLPFTSQNTASSGVRYTVLFQGYTKANYTQVVGFININSTTGTFRAGGSGQTIATLAVGDIPTGGTVQIEASGHYFV